MYISSQMLQKVEIFPRGKSADYLISISWTLTNEQVSLEKLRQGDYMFQTIETKVCQCFKADNAFLSTRSIPVTERDG